MPRSSSFRPDAVALLVLLVAALAPVAATAGPSQQTRFEGYVADDLYLREREHPGPVRSVEVHVQPGAEVDFVPVLSGGRVDGGHEVVSTMCDRVGGVVCVNANFTTCPRCSQPFGGIVQDSVIVRSPSPAQDQVSVVDGRFTLSPWEWAGAVVPAGGGDGVVVDGINVPAGPDDVVLHTRRYGPSTGAPAGSFEVIYRSPAPIVTGVGVRHHLELTGTHGHGDAPIPVDGVVLTARGAGADELWAFVERTHGNGVDLVTTTPDHLEQSFAGHPVLLRDGERAALEPGDGKVVNRHPRTVIGWDDLGSTWVVVVDGRQDHSRGMTLAEVTDHLVALGARHAVNLDGGGSSTMVTHCPSESGWCLRNRPSDGAERAVPVALAIRTKHPTPPPATSFQTQSPPSPPPPPPPPEDVSSASVVEDAPAPPDPVAEVAAPATPAVAPVEDPPASTEPATAPAVVEIESPEPTTTTTVPVPDPTPAPGLAAVTVPMPADFGDRGRAGGSAPAALAGLLVLLDGLALCWLRRRRGPGALPSTT